jgi:hypothetical protein
MPAKRAWFLPGVSAQQRQRGFPSPLNAQETRAANGAPLRQVPPFGGVVMAMPRRNDIGAAGYVPNFGRPLVNPIGAGIYAPNRPQASYGSAGQYVNHTIFWAQQTIPTTIPLGPLVSPQTLKALLGTVNVQAAVRTT